MRRSHALFLSTSLMIMAAAGAAHAQSTIEELVVTAEKREQNLQDVPVAISAYTSDTREKLGIVSVQDITNFTPGLQYQNGLDRLSIRGIGRLTNNLATEGGVAIYYDGIYTASSFEAAQSPLLVDRVEVLRGPQGTLYGRNSIGGALNVISKRPTTEFMAEARATFASYDRQVFEGYISGPISDALRVRLSVVRTNQNEGYYTNVSGLPDEGGVTDGVYYEGQIAADVGENIDVWVKYGFTQYHNNGRNTTFIGNYDTRNIIGPNYTTPAPAFGFNLAHTQIGTVMTNPGKTDPWKINTDTTSQQNLKDAHNLTVDVTYHMDSMDLRYLGGYRSYFYQTVGDYDSTPVTSYTYPSTCPTCFSQFDPRFQGIVIFPSYVNIFYEDKQWYSHELNLTSTGDGPLQWIVGAYYYNESYTQRQDIPAPNQPQYEFNMRYRPSLAVGATALAPRPWPNPGRSVYDVNADALNQSQAAFAQVDYEINDAWKITGGIRYTHDRKKILERSFQTCWLFASFVCSATTPAGVNVNPSGVNDGPADWQGGGITPSLAANTPLGQGVLDFPYRNLGTGFLERHIRYSWGAWSGTLGVDWKPNDDAMLYAKYSRGYKAGGFNVQTLQADPTTDEETVDAYEVGAKLNIGQTFQVNGAVYYYNYTNLQTPVSVTPPSGGPGSVQFFNAPKVRTIGVELEAIWTPIDNLTLRANYAYLDPQLKGVCCFIDPQDPYGLEPGAKPATNIANAGTLTGAQVGQDVSGQVLPASPKHKFAVNASYVFDFSPGALTLSATYAWKDKTYYSIFNRYYNLAPAYDQIDLRATWTDKDDRYSIVGYVRNAADEIGYDGVSALRQSIPQVPAGQVAPLTGPLAPSVQLLEPRTYGVQFQYRF